MKKIVLLLLLLVLAIVVAGCDTVPQTFQGKYYEDGFREMGEDFDDLTGARTL